MSNSSLDVRFSTEPVLPLIFEMAFPAMVAQLVNLLYSIVDRIYIGHIPDIGPMALGGVGVCTTLITLISAFAMIVSGGGAPLASIALGEGNNEKAKIILGNGAAMLLCFSVVLVAVVGAMVRPLLALCGASPFTLFYAMEYFSLYLMGTPFVMVTVGLNPFLNAQGKAPSAMLSVILGAFLNIVLDPICIFVLKMGVRGAALATVVSQAASAALILFLLTRKSARLRLEARRIRLHDKTVWKIASLGISPFVMASTESLVGFVLNRELVGYGDIYVSALAIMQSALQCTAIPLTGFAQGANPIVSYNYGHHNALRVKAAFKVMLIFMATFNFVLTGVMVLFPRGVARIFTGDPALIETVGRWMPLFCSGFLIFGLQRACQQTFVALGQAGVSLCIALLRKVVLLIPLVLVLSHLFGLKGVFLGEAIADGCCALLCTAIFAYRFPRILRRIS